MAFSSRPLPSVSSFSSMLLSWMPSISALCLTGVCTSGTGWMRVSGWGCGLGGAALTGSGGALLTATGGCWGIGPDRTTSVTVAIQEVLVFFFLLDLYHGTAGLRYCLYLPPDFSRLGDSTDLRSSSTLSTAAACFFGFLTGDFTGAYRLVVYVTVYTTSVTSGSHSCYMSFWLRSPRRLWAASSMWLTSTLCDDAKLPNSLDVSSYYLST